MAAPRLRSVESAAPRLHLRPEVPLEPASSVALRFALYTAALFAFTASLPVLVGHGDMVVFKEDGPIEDAHVALLVLTGLVAAGTGARWRTQRECCYLLAMGCVIAGLRELDSFLEALNPVWDWKLPVALVAGGAAVFAWRRRSLLASQLYVFFSYRALPILWAGFVVTVPFAQLVGHGELLALVMGDDYTRDYKRVIEEISELVGYALVFIGSLELAWQVRLQDRERRPGWTRLAAPAAADAEPGLPARRSEPTA